MKIGSLLNNIKKVRLSKRTFFITHNHKIYAYGDIHIVTVKK